MTAGAAPNVTTSASESYSLPNSLVALSWRAIMPSKVSKTAAKRSERQAVSKKSMDASLRPAAMASIARVAYTIARNPKKRFRIVSDVGITYTPRRKLGRTRFISIASLRNLGDHRQSHSRFVAWFHQDQRGRRKEDIDARAEFDHAHALAARHFIAFFFVEYDPSREKAGDLFERQRRAARVGHHDEVLLVVGR